MKKNLKLIMAVLLVVVMAFGVFACSGNNNGGGTIEVTGVTLNHSEYTLLVGRQVLLTPTIAPHNATNPAVDWESSDPTRAAVDDNGQVTAVSMTDGTPVIITARSAANSAHFATASITVNPAPPDVMMTGLRITVGLEASESGAFEAGAQGDSINLKVEPIPYNAGDFDASTILWRLETPNHNVALPLAGNQEGYLAAFRATTATVIVSAIGFSGLVEEEVTFEFENAPIEPIAGLSFNHAEIAGFVGQVHNYDGEPVEIEDNGVTLEAFWDGEPVSVIWQSQDVTIAAIDADGEITFGDTAGYTTITATFDNNGEIETNQVRVAVVDITGWRHIDAVPSDIIDVNMAAPNAGRRRYFEHIRVLRTPYDVQNIPVVGKRDRAPDDSPHTYNWQSSSLTRNASIAGLMLLGNDIDMSVTREWNDGAGFEPINRSLHDWYFDGPSMVGTLDGQGFALRNLYINRPNETDVGLFARANLQKNVLIQDYIRNLSIEGGQIIGGAGTGAFVGRVGRETASSPDNFRANQAGGLHNVWADIEVIGTGGRVGGFVGNLSGAIRNSFITSRIETVGNRTGVFSGSAEAAGINLPPVPEYLWSGVFNSFAMPAEDSTFLPALGERPSGNFVVNNSGMRDFGWLRIASNFADWNTSIFQSWEEWEANIWYIVDGALPRLTTPWERAQL
ncbi:MAG: Ig-like domain-containing protein [Firmicutes bacterium]|nr:Ig-like domain-containing protein [Bacillota bacterium]